MAAAVSWRGAKGGSMGWGWAGGDGAGSSFALRSQAITE